MLYNREQDPKEGDIPIQATTCEAVLQNLKDAGCNPDIIARFMTCQDAGKTKDSLRVLKASVKAVKKPRYTLQMV